MEKENNFPDLIFYTHFHNILFKMYKFTFIVLTIIVPVFGYVIRKSWSLETVRKFNFKIVQEPWIEKLLFAIWNHLKNWICWTTFRASGGIYQNSSYIVMETILYITKSYLAIMLRDFFWMMLLPFRLQTTWISKGCWLWRAKPLPTWSKENHLKKFEKHSI